MTIAAAASPDISRTDLENKSKQEIDELAREKGLVQDPQKPNRWRDPHTNKERIRIDPGH